MSDKAGVPQQATGTIDTTGLIKKKCPKCNGAMLAENDIDGYSHVCINCGHRVYHR